MKKLLLSALVLASAIGVSAKDYAVYQDGALADGLAVYGWWNNATDFKATNPDGDGLVMSFKAADGSAAASFGIHAPADSGITGPLHSSTLTFKWYATTPGQTYTVRLTSNVEENYNFTTSADNIGQWNEVSLPVATTYPGVAKGWNEFTKSGDGYILGLVLEGGTAESVIYLSDVVYKDIDEAWVKPEVKALPVPTSVPVPAHDAESVVSVFSNDYNNVCTFGIGGWGQSTQISDVTIDGKTVKNIKFFNYLGWELNPAVDATSCNMMHVDFFAANEGKFGFTPISPGKEKAWIAPEVKVGEWNSYDVPLSHWDNVNLANVYQLKFDQGDGNQEGYIANVYFYNDGNGDQPVVPGYELPASWYGSTSISTKNENMTEAVDLDFDYVLTANADQTLTATVTVMGDWESLPGLGGFQINIPGDPNEWGPSMRPDADGVFERTTTATFTPGQAIAPFIWIPYAMKGERVNMFDGDNYTFGAANEAPVSDPKLSLKAQVDEVGTDSAVISYTLKASNHFDGVDVKVMLGGVEISENPYTITGLNEMTEYTFLINAVAELEGVKYETEPVALTFKTKSSTAVDKKWYAISDGLVKNAYLVGESEAMRRDIPISIESEVTYNTDGTITVVATPHLAGEIVGLVPKITISSGEYKFEYQDMAVADGKWSITTNTEYPEEHNIGWLYYYLAFAGGAQQIAVNGYTTGLENEKPVYATAAALELKLTKTGFTVNDEIAIEAVVKDAAGHYLFNDPVEFAFVSNPQEAFVIKEGNKLYAQRKGYATLEATAGALSSNVDVVCHTSSQAERLAIVNLTGDHDSLDLAFDSNENTQVEWNCSETEQHTLTVDLGEVKHIEVVSLVWEGASATHYTVRLHNDGEHIIFPNEDDVESASIRQNVTAKDGCTYTVENGEGGAGVTARKDLYQEDMQPVAARYATLETSKAFNAGWGIKLKEMVLTGTDTDVETTIVNEFIDNTNLPISVYTLCGVKVADSFSNLPAGIYIVRQGNKSLKIAIR